jgi:ABC-type sugar transport system ATPase subunit
LVKLEQIEKSFGPVHVLKGVDLELHPGEAHALVGENGAGKSTLMKILSGSWPYGDYSGRILLNGKEARFSSPADASAAGIAIIHQELSAFPDLTVAENLFVGAWPGSSGIVDWKLMRDQAFAWFESIGVRISPDALMGELSTGGQQLVEIAKSLFRNADVLILDEPTSSLTPQESHRLFALMADLKKKGKTLVYISHRMEEVFGQCDRVTVLRDGMSVLAAPIGEITENQVISAMVGRSLDRLFPEKSHKPKNEVLLSVKEFVAVEKSSGRRLGPLAFDLHKGEVLGFSGLLGAGRSELLQSVLGDDRFAVTGQIFLEGKERRWRNPLEASEDGVMIVGEDRRRDSLLPSRSLEENSGILRLNLGGLVQRINPGRERKQTLAELEKLHTNFRDTSQLITELSGGNQQKVIFSRVLQCRPKVVVLDEPTRGVDVGAKFEIYQILLQLAEQGLGILLVSSDLPELMALSDRVVVLSEGTQTGVLTEHEIQEEKIMALAVGRETGL